MVSTKQLISLGIPMDRVLESKGKSGGICCVCESNETSPITDLSFNPFSLDENPEVIHVGFDPVCDMCEVTLDDVM